MKSEKRFIVRCGLLPWNIDGHNEIEVAYLIANDLWGQGLGTETAQEALDYSFETLQLSHLISLVEEGNLASIRLAQKIGMSFERAGQDDKVPFLLYARSKS